MSNMNVQKGPLSAGVVGMMVARSEPGQGGGKKRPDSGYMLETESERFC